MAKAISDDELQLKKRARRRLVGAVALVLLIVVFLPMILDSEPKPLNQDIAITIPAISKPETFHPDPPAPEASPQPASPAPRVTGMPSAPVQPGPLRATDAKPGAPGKPEARVPKQELKAAAPAHGAADEGFVVQLGAFSNAANARLLQKKLQDNKFKAYTELIKGSGGDRTRVRVGPYATRDAAEKARERLKALKLIIGEASVVRRE